MADSNQFYAKFVPLYDKLISYENRKERETPFWNEIFKKYDIHKAHDCACGTGHHVMLFNQLGVSCSGSDLSLDMIKKAQENCEQRNIKASLFQADFRNLQAVSDDSLDLIVNLGNSLAYLSNSKDNRQFFKETLSKLKEKGILVIETRNYDFLLKAKPRFIPLSFRDNFGFIYVLDYLKKQIKFNVVYFNLQTQEFQTFETVYYPLLYGKLLKYIEGSGFEVKERYSDYKFEEFNLERSHDLILILKRKG